MAAVAAPLSIDPGGYPTTVVTAASTTGAGASSVFSILDRPLGGPRNLWLSLGVTTGNVTALLCSLKQSFDGGTTYRIIQGGIDLVNSPAQLVSPEPSPGASLIINVDTLSGGGTASIIASSN